MPWALIQTIAPTLPDHCKPTNAFLYHLSSTFHTCVPTNLAFISTLLGTLSIVSWLFAQLPQIHKNYTIGSTTGLSIFFLGEWLLGDLSNLLGCIFMRQALWQIVIASYYCFVDCMLVGQWLWYEQLQHGRPLRSVWTWGSVSPSNMEGAGDMQQVIEGVSISSKTPTLESRPPSSKIADSSPKPIPWSRPMGMFRMPTFSRSPLSPSEPSSSYGTPTNRTIHRLAPSASPMPSPKTLLYISLILSIAARGQATPLSSLHSTLLAPLSPHHHNNNNHYNPTHHSSSATTAAGRLLSWLSTLLYLGSRLPQLYKNHSRRSTAGLSASLFVAAFFGNLFYSASLATNPCAWASLPAHGGRGWVGQGGSERDEWVGRAAPFWLGAAGVLVLDAAVGAQFLWFEGGRGQGARAVVVGVGEEEVVGVRVGAVGRRWRWRRVSGWMRGWVPSVSEVGTPRPESKAGVGGEGEALLGHGGGERGGYGAA